MHSKAFILLLAAQGAISAVLSPRETQAPTCVGLSVKSNNGNRKVALVIDSSGSMAYADPYDLRLAAGRSLNEWLITTAEAGSGKQADQVAVIDFDDTAVLQYALGDPAGANSSFDQIDASGGTYIAGGVAMGIAQLTGSSSGSTSGRSSIIVFTDGEDYDTKTLVTQINKAQSLGIRVSFGFLDASSSIQDKTVLAAIQNSGGVYATITTEDASNNFINFAILNGLTKNDNPSGNNSTLLAGLTIATFISGTQTKSLTYNAQANEHINFTIQSVDAGVLTAEAIFGGKVLNGTTTSLSYYKTNNISVTAPSAGTIELKVTAKKALPNSMFVLGASSNMPIQNCTLAINPNAGGGGGGLGTGAKVGLGLGIPLMFAGIGLGAFFLLKYFGHKLPPFKNPFSKPPPVTNTGTEGHQPPMYDGEKPGMTSNAVPLDGLSNLPFVPPPPPPTDPTQKASQDPRKHRHRRMKRLNTDEEPHHHHLPLGHQCISDKCPLLDPAHVCKDPEVEPKGPCACTDKECLLNDQDHDCKCEKDEDGCACADEECETTKEMQKRMKARLAGQVGMQGAKMGVTEVVRAAL